MKKWISVKDQAPERLPKSSISKHVLCACENDPIEGGYFQRTLYYDYDYGKWFLNYNEPVNWRITHWMPLPEPPKE